MSARADEYVVAKANPYDELSGQRLDSGRGYDKRSVETFRARALDLVDELLRHVTELEDRLTAGGQPTLSEAEADLLHAFRFADSFQRRGAQELLEGSDANEPVGDEGENWLTTFDDAVEPPPADVAVDLRVPPPSEPELRVPLRVARTDNSPRPPTPPTAWGGWVD